MNKEIITAFAVYFVIIGLIAAIFTISDKRRAVKGKWRISEATLIILALLGGSVSEYLTMKKIHHKTNHAKFMIGLPLIIFAQIISIVLLVYKVTL